MAATGVGPDPQNVRLEPLQSYDFITFDGLTGTRYWPKLRCDEQGNRCEIGESGGPEEVCHKTAGCAPPVDTKFEASFGAHEDWVDISLVDGFTLPFRFEMQGNCTAGFGNKEVTTNTIDCSRLSFDQCPRAENLGEISSNVNLQVLHPDTQQAVGCYSPCSKLTLSQWGNTDANGAPPSDPRIAPYCCPTPPESPHECRAGPVPDTSFVQAVHSMCPGVYGYSYDDGMGLLKCSSTTRYEVTFYCPASSPPPSVPAADAVAATVPAAAAVVTDAAPQLPAAAATPIPAFPSVPMFTPPEAAPTPGAAGQQPAFLALVRKFESGRGTKGSMGLASAPATLAACLLAAFAVVFSLVMAALRMSPRGGSAGPHRPAVYAQVAVLEGLTSGLYSAPSVAEAAA